MKVLKQILFIVLFIGCFSAKAQNIPSWKVTKLQDYIAKSDSVLVVNFWATFCKPCIEEIPFFETIVKKYKNQKVKLLLVSLDLRDAYPSKINAFVKKNKYKSQIVWLNETNADYFCPKVDGDWGGGIPSTLIINKKTGYRKFFEEEMTKEQLDREIQNAISTL